MADAELPGADITALVPARDEAATIASTVTALANQSPDLRVLVIDDQSSDATADCARAAAPDRVEVVSGQPLPAGWTGKLWALEQGLERVATERVLLLDADIELRPGMLAALSAHQRAGDYALVSVMARLRMHGFWERLLMPPFVWFFKLLYPFALANGSRRRHAAAAGGCILTECRWLQAIGGFAGLKGAVIDDCTLAARIKHHGGRTWIGLTRGALSHRTYDRPGDIDAMVARTAFSQLRYSFALLLVCTLLMVATFWGPVAGLFGSAAGRLAATGALALMVATYTPLLRYYGLSPAWSLTLPLAATLYLGMTWGSAIRYLRGVRARWRGRQYAA